MLDVQQYKKELYEIQNATTVSYTTLDSINQYLVVDTKTREIKLPVDFCFLAVENDHAAKTFYFEIDRYFEGVDLSSHTCIVQYICSDGEKTTQGIYPVVEYDLSSVEDKIIFGWTINNDVTSIPGKVIFAVRFYSINDNVFTYNFNTLEAKSNVLSGIDTTESATNITPSVLTKWEYRMNELNTSITNDIATFESKMTEHVENAANSATASAESAAAAAKALEDNKSFVESQKETFIGYNKRETNVKYANALIGRASGKGQAVVNDAWSAPLSNLEILGESNQLQTKGYQLLNLRKGKSGTREGVTYTQQGDGSYTRTGTATDIAANMWFWGKYSAVPEDDGSNVLFTLEPGKSYTIKDCVIFTVEDGVNKELTPTSTAILISSDSYPKGFRITGIRNPPQVVDKTYNDKIYPMVNEGVEMPWEPYTGGRPSPSPAYQEGEWTVGKNLCETRLPKISKDGLTYTSNSDGSFTLIGTNTSEYTRTFRINQGVEGGIDNLKDFEDGQYTLSITTDDDISNLGLVLAQNNTWKMFIHTESGEKYKTANIVDATDCFIYISVKSGATVNITGKVQLERGTLTPWEPYTGGKPGFVPDTTRVQLFDASRIPSKTKNGVTMTNNGDGSFTTIGTPTGPFDSIYAYDREESLKFIDYIEKHLGFYSLTSSPSFRPFCLFKFSDGSFEINTLGNPKEITQSMIDDFRANEDTIIKIGFYLANGEQISPGSVKPMMWAKKTPPTEDDWAPFNEDFKPSILPGYPQVIEGIGTTTGSQLFDASRIPSKTVGGSTITNNGDGSFTLSGTGTIADTFFTGYILSEEDSKRLYPAGTYSISQDTANPMPCVSFRSGGHQFAYIQLGTPQVTITPKQIDEGEYTVAVGFIGNRNTTVTPGPSVVWPMCNSGTTVKPWEPFIGGTPYPSPECPYPLNVTVTGENLLPICADNTYVSTSGVTFKTMSNGTIRISGTATGHISAYIINGSVQGLTLQYADGIKLCGDYYLSGKVDGITLRLRKDDLSDELVSDAHKNLDGIYKLNIFIKEGTTLDVDLKPMLNSGSTAKPWQPHCSQKITLPLTAPLHGIEDYRDRITCKDGVWGIERNIGVVDNNAWIKNNKMSGTAGHRFFYEADNAAAKIANIKNIKIYCTKYTQKKTTSYLKEGDYISTDETHTNNRINIRTLERDFETIEEFKEFMADAVTIYPLGSPTWEPFPDDIQKQLNSLATYKGTTHVSISVGGNAPDVNVEYVQDTNKVVSDLKDAILGLTDQMVDIQAQLLQATINQIKS